MTDFRGLLERYRNESLSEAEKGTKFERLMRAYLLALPKYKGLLDKVWLWHDFPYRKDFGTGHDLGIDLVALTVTGEYWAVQCKCYAEDAHIAKESVDTFLSTSGKRFSDHSLEPQRFSRRLWISTTDSWSANAEASLLNQVPPVMKVGLANLAQSPVDWAVLEAKAHGDREPKPWESENKRNSSRKGSYMNQSDFMKELCPVKQFKRVKGDKRNVVVSMFSGAGGLDMGFFMEDYNIVWANDFDEDACATYKANIGEHIRCGDIEGWMYELEQFKDNVDVLIGGPPCQGFSVAGKMDPVDPRSQNVWRYLKALGIVRPKAFLMENVKALGTLDKWREVREKLLTGMRELGYNANYIVVNASDYNVPQNRERVLFIGFREKSNEPLDLEALLKPYKIKGPTVKEVLAVLDRPGAGNNAHVCNAKVTFCQKPVMRKSPYAGMIFNGLGRPIRINGYCATLPASMGGNKTPIIDEEELYNGKKSFVEEYHKGLADGSIVPEFKEAPKRLRRLTVEEAAALQTFPLGYKFVGSRTTMYKQIGNAVPCNLSRQVAKMMRKKLEAMK